MRLNREELVAAIQSRAARVAVGPSTVRGRGNKGVMDAAREFCCHLDLTPFATEQGTAFAKALNRATDELLDALPPGARHWGLARKVVDVFLRDCLYTTYLNGTFALERAEAFFELPLDSETGTRLWQAVGGAIPDWPGVKYLRPELNSQYQEAAAAEAAKWGIARVHLDAFWWAKSRDRARPDVTASPHSGSLKSSRANL